MTVRAPSSRRHYDEFREELREEVRKQKRAKADPEGAAEEAKQEEARKKKVDNRSERQKRWDAYYDKKTIKRGFPELFRGFWTLLDGHHWLLFTALATLTVSTVVGLVTPAAPKFVIDYVLTDNPGPAGIPDWLPVSRDKMALLLSLAGALIVFELFSLIISIFGRFQLLRLSKRLENQMRRRVFQHAIRLPLWRVHQLKSGGVASVLRADAAAPADLITSMIYMPWRSLIQLVGSMVVLAIVDWVLLVGAVLLFPLIYFSHRTWIARIRPVYRSARETREMVDSHATEAFGGMRVVRTFGQERAEGVRFVGGVHLMTRKAIFAWWWSRALESVWRIALPAATILIIVYGGGRVIEGTLTLGDVMMFITYSMMLLGPLESLVGAALQIQNGLAGFERVLDLMDENREFEGQEVRERLTRDDVRGRVDIEGLAFAYPGADKAVLENVELHVEPGQTVAFVGPSGAGKTTLSNLIARFYDPQEGSIRLDGRDLREIDVMSFRDLLGIVEQDVFLFDGTIRDNIAYARRDATQEDVEHAAKLAHAHEFILDTEDGYDTIIGERGVRLSGGQKQRIALARAILKDPSILILDEATSNLDSESEALIQESLSELMEGRTSFVIAHRLSTVKDADQIVVLENGSIVESGTHDELLARDGRYATFLAAQLQRAAKKERADADRAAGREPEGEAAQAPDAAE